MLTSKVKKIGPKLIYLENGKKIYRDTGIDTKGKNVWQPLEGEALHEWEVINYRLDAKKWLKRTHEDEIAAVRLYNLMNNTKGDRRKYYNETTQPEREALKDKKISYLRKMYRQPNWCGNQNAMLGVIGCDKIMMGEKITPQSCWKCNYFIQGESPLRYHRLRVLAGLTIREINEYLGITDYDRIESGERQATTIENEMLHDLFIIDGITVEQVQMLIQTMSDKDKQRRYDPFFKKYGFAIYNKL